MPSEQFPFAYKPKEPVLPPRFPKTIKRRVVQPKSIHFLARRLVLSGHSIKWTKQKPFERPFWCFCVQPLPHHARCLWADTTFLYWTSSSSLFETSSDPKQHLVPIDCHCYVYYSKSILPYTYLNQLIKDKYKLWKEQDETKFHQTKNAIRALSFPSNRPIQRKATTDTLLQWFPFSSFAFKCPNGWSPSFETDPSPPFPTPTLPTSAF